MKTVKLKKLELRHTDRGVIWAEHYSEPRPSPRIQPGHMISVKYQDATIFMKVLHFYNNEEMKAEIQAIEPDNVQLSVPLREGMQIRIQKEHVHTCEL